VRPICLRRAHEKEMKRHVPSYPNRQG
jgi:hypothetical protein